jgi:hypothetical protein
MTNQITNTTFSEQFNQNITWSFEHDELLSNWGDHASCFTWMHNATQRKYSRINMCLGIPVIVLSTISGTANFGISAIFPANFNYGNIIIGSVSLVTGIISTVSNFLKYAQAEEAHRISCVQWSKFKRTIETELSLHPGERQRPGDFIKYAKAELDRLMEQSPIIPQDIIDLFIKTFKRVKNVKMPEVCNKLEHTIIYSELYSKKTEESNTPNHKGLLNTVSKKITSFIFPKKNNPDSENSSSSSDNGDVIISINDDNKNIINYSNSSPLGKNPINVSNQPIKE